jgi:hypothetical protein
MLLENSRLVPYLIALNKYGCPLLASELLLFLNGARSRGHFHLWSRRIQVTRSNIVLFKSLVRSDHSFYCSDAHLFSGCDYGRLKRTWSN